LAAALRSSGEEFARPGGVVEKGKREGRERGVGALKESPREPLRVSGGVEIVASFSGATVSREEG
jgi:hypothetical protein